VGVAGFNDAGCVSGFACCFGGFGFVFKALVFVVEFFAHGDVAFVCGSLVGGHVLGYLH
jgi:hypothetical protein